MFERSCLRQHRLFVHSSLCLLRNQLWNVDKAGCPLNLVKQIPWFFPDSFPIFQDIYIYVYIYPGKWGNYQYIYIYIAENSLIFPWHVCVKFPDFTHFSQIPWFFPAGFFPTKFRFPWFFPVVGTLTKVCMARINYLNLLYFLHYPLTAWSHIFTGVAKEGR